ncbi:hypothetical protein LPMP_140750 [Leishmania panamensis]|uniref:Uncharacterized protein n=1 Tax=Leishmania panamensis TaxID=5679 RepID=A0A088RLK2_LEIPA|nr:hypothetical protein LPMP_140750 [Leishmania panamensis]AIN96655.1 hypothetical protein LPMP_140750 [Leishmania panamensis]
MTALATSSSAVSVRRQRGHGRVSLRALEAALLLALLLLEAFSSVALIVNAVKGHHATVRDDARVQSVWLASAAAAAASDMRESNVHVLRKMNQQNWHLLDGDQLIPGDGKSVAHARPLRGAPLTGVCEGPPECESPPLPRAPQTHSDAGRHSKQAGVHPRDHTTSDAPQDAAPVGQHHCRTKHPARVTSSLHQQHKAAAEYAGTEPPRISLDSLRLVIQLEDEVATKEDNVEVHEDGDDKHASPQRRVPHHSRRLRENSAHLHSRDYGHRRGRARDSNAHRHHSFLALREQPVSGLRRLAVEQHAIEHHSDGDGAAEVVSTDAKNVTSMTESKEERQRRCLVVNTQDSKAASMESLREGTPRKCCLIVPAEVGNDIPSSENNAKRTVAIMTLFVSALFGAFLFVV